MPSDVTNTLRWRYDQAKGTVHPHPPPSPKQQDLGTQLQDLAGYALQLQANCSTDSLSLPLSL